jgi:hypothetical protein
MPLWPTGSCPMRCGGASEVVPVSVEVAEAISASATTDHESSSCRTGDRRRCQTGRRRREGVLALVPPPAFWVCASPAATRRLRAALASRSWRTPQAGQAQARFAAAAGGAPLETLRADIGQQRTPGRPGQPHPERRACARKIPVNSLRRVGSGGCTGVCCGDDRSDPDCARACARSVGRLVSCGA